MLTSFPSLLAEDGFESEGGDGDGKVGGGGRKASIVEGIARVLGMLRGGAGEDRKRRGSESSLMSWDGSDGGSGSGLSKSVSRSASRSSSCAYSSS